MNRRSTIALTISVVLALALFAGAPVSPAAETLIVPGDFPSADQYVESVPTGRGPGTTRVGEDATVPLPSAISERLVRGDDAKLEQIATSVRLGAPQRKLPDAQVDSPGIPAAVVGAAVEGGGDTSLWLLLALLSVTAVLAATAGRRRYLEKRRTGGSGG